MICPKCGYSDSVRKCECGAEVNISNSEYPAWQKDHQKATKCEGKLGK